MNFSYTEEQALLRKEIIEFAQRTLNDQVIVRDRQQTFPHDLWLKCGEMKLQGLPVPQEYGGSGLDPLTTAIVLEALGYGCHDGGLTFAVGAHLLACVVSVWKHGSQEQKSRYLPGLCSGKLIAANGMTESGSGSDAFAMTTKARPEGGGFRVSGHKTFCSNGPIADVAIIYAVTDERKGYHGGITAFLLEKGEPGFTTGQTVEKMGVRTCPMGELIMDDVYVPRQRVIGNPGAGALIFSQVMEWERACLVAIHVGAMEWLLEQAIEYTRTRKASGRAIGEFQAISHRVAEMKVRLEASRLLTYKAAWQLDQVKYAALDASITKLFVSEAYQQTALDTLRISGGYGYLTEHEVERAVRDAIGGTLYSGTSEINRNIIAKWLGL